MQMQTHTQTLRVHKALKPLLLIHECLLFLTEQNRQNVKSWFGLHHVGVVVDKWNEANKFYTEVMGGKQAFGGSFPPGVGELQDDILDAFNASKTNSFWGFPYKSKLPQVLDITGKANGLNYTL